MSEPPAEPVLLVDKHADDRIWVITMNRPHRMNSLGGGMVAAITETFEAYRDDPVARVAILTGAGDRAFCAGADLKETSELRLAAASGGETSNQFRPDRRGRLPFVPLSEGLDIWKPTIAAINGFAVAGGFMVAMQCDIRIIADHAKIGIAETRWNMGGSGWMAPLTRQIGLGNALELALWGDTQYTAQRAYEIGWAQRVVPLPELMPSAMAYAERMLDLAPRAVSNIKRMLYRGFNMDPVASMTEGYWLEQNLAGMKDSVEGPTAFAEKRKPDFIDG
jgi:enoyl-CoA hydratase/carnithine racemase